MKGPSSHIRPRSGFLPLLAATSVLVGSAGAGAQSPPSACEAFAAERAQLQAERAAIRETIGDMALGRSSKPKKGVSAGAVGQAVLGTAASVLLPFGVGAAVNLGVAAARQGAKKGAEAAPAAQGPDASELIAREQAIDERLAQLEKCGA